MAADGGKGSLSLSLKTSVDKASLRGAVDEVKKGVDEVAKAAEKPAAFNLDTSGATQDLQELRDQLKKAGVSDVLLEDSRALDDVRGQLSKTTEEAQQTADSMHELAKATDDVAKSSPAVETITRGFADMRQSASEVRMEIGDRIGGTLSEFGGVVSDIGDRLNSWGLISEQAMESWDQAGKNILFVGDAISMVVRFTETYQSVLEGVRAIKEANLALTEKTALAELSVADASKVTAGTGAGGGGAALGTSAMTLAGVGTVMIAAEYAAIKTSEIVGSAVGAETGKADQPRWQALAKGFVAGWPAGLVAGGGVGALATGAYSMWNADIEWRNNLPAPSTLSADARRQALGWGPADIKAQDLQRQLRASEREAGITRDAEAILDRRGTRKATERTADATERLAKAIESSPAITRGGGQDGWERGGAGYGR
jgi:hypothetical protein